MYIFQHFQAVAEALMRIDVPEIEKAVHILERARKDDAFVWIVGNGGSAATASHFANDLAKVCYIRAISVPDMTPMVTAYGNDDGWEEMYWKIVGRYARARDVVITISCSGNSPNVVKVAEHISLEYLIVLTGSNRKCRLVEVGAGVIIHAEAEDIKVQEDVHLAVCHAIVGALIP